MTDLNDIRSRTKSASEYIRGLKDKWGSYQLQRFENYELNPEVVGELKKYVDDITVVVIGASWCKDCREAIPVLMRLEEDIGLEVRVFGTVKTAPLDPDNRWAIPPSPPEAKKWDVKAIPWIEIFRKDGTRIGTIIEKPIVKPTLEAELLRVIKG